MEKKLYNHEWAVSMTTKFIEDTVEQAAPGWLREVGYLVLHGPDIAPGEAAAERDSRRPQFMKHSQQGLV
jgi:hypothetical protein